MSEHTAVKEPEAKVETVVLNEPETAAAPAAKVLPTRDELKGKGWSAAELDKGEKLGMVAKPGAADSEKKPEAKAEVKPEAAAADVGDKKIEAKPEAKRQTLPDFTMTPEQEKVFLETFGAGTAPRAMYFRMKNERQSRQASESRVRELETRLQALEKAPPAARTAEVDAEGRLIDPEAQPLTLKALKEMQKAEAEEFARQQAESNDRRTKLVGAQTDQEEYARAAHADFDATVELAKDVIKNVEQLYPDKVTQTKVYRLVRELQLAAAHADKIGLDEYNAAIIAYELGQMHPKYGKALEQSEDTGVKDPKANGGLTPGQMKRIEANTQRRGSSAAVPSGGGKRTVSVEDVGLSELNKMTFAERKSFREKHPDRYAKLLRG